MMREIKFRARFPNFKRFLRNYETESHLMDILNGKLVCNIEEVASFSGKLDYYKDTGYILQQYTGLKDENGVEIYEGDIVKFELDFGYGLQEVISEVVFDTAGFKLKSGVGIEYMIKDFGIVIGNIYENKALL